MPLTKHLFLKNGEQNTDSVWWLKQNKEKKPKHVAFSLKTACTFYLSCVVCVVLSARPRRLQGCRFVRCSIVDVNSVWGLNLWQTGRHSLSSQQPTSLSATRAATKSIMFGLLCHFRHRGGSFHLLQLLPELDGASSVRATCQAKERFTYLETLGKPSCILGERALRRGEEGRSEEMRDSSCDATSCVSQETVYTTVLLAPMAFLLRMLMAYSPRLVPFSSFRSGFLRMNIFTKWGQMAWQHRCDV